MGATAQFGTAEAFQPYNEKLSNLIAVSDDLVSMSSGTSDAFLLALVASAATVGVTIPTVATGIGLAGTNTTGIRFSGTITKGIDFTTATPVYSAYVGAASGSRNNPMIKIGSWDDPLVIVQTSDHYVPIQVNITKSGDIAFDTAAMRLKVATGTAHQPTSAIGCLQLRQTIAYNVASSCILNADVTVSGATTITSGSLLGAYFSIQGAGAITKAGDNDCSVLTAVNNHTAAGIDNVAIFLQNGTGSNVDEIVKIAVTNGTATTGLSIPVGVGAIGCAVKIGTLGASGATGSAHVVDATNSAVMRVYAETAIDLTSAALVRAGMFRMLISGATEITSNAECFGVQGQLVAKQTTLCHDNAGVLGTFEVNTTHVHIDGTGGDNVTSAVLGRCGGSVASCTVSATGILAGVAAMSNIADGNFTVTSGGIFAGLYVGRYASTTKQVWDSGLYIDPTACTVPITLGKDADGVPVVIVVGNFADGGASGFGHGSLGLDTTDGLLFVADTNKQWQQVTV